jgi:hypothetical protein
VQSLGGNIETYEEVSEEFEGYYIRKAKPILGKSI